MKTYSFSHSLLNNENGQAMLEAVPLMSVFVILMAYGLGLFGVIHSGILFSMSARNYAFETFRNRTNTEIFRYSGNAKTSNLVGFKEVGFRYHLVSDGMADQNSDVTASKRPIIMGLNRRPTGEDSLTHNQNIYGEIITGERNQTVGVHPAWLMIGYGLCIDAQCGAE